MGDQSSLQIVRGNQKSVVLFRHWGGCFLDWKQFIELAMKRHGQLMASGDPDRMLVALVASAFDENANENKVYKSFLVALKTLKKRKIRFVTDVARQNKREEFADAILGADSEDGDNSKHGHFILRVPEKKIGAFTLFGECLGEKGKFRAYAKVGLPIKLSRVARQIFYKTVAEEKEMRKSQLKALREEKQNDRPKSGVQLYY